MTDKSGKRFELGRSYISKLALLTAGDVVTATLLLGCSLLPMKQPLCRHAVKKLRIPKGVLRRVSPL